VAIDITSDDDRARTFLKEKGILFPSLKGAADGVGATYGVTSTPTAIVIDRQGRILFRRSGFDPSKGVEPLAAMVDAVLDHQPIAK
jgi:hypothetical protein